jgi:hypothetical protein
MTAAPMTAASTARAFGETATLFGAGTKDGERSLYDTPLPSINEMIDDEASSTMAANVDASNSPPQQSLANTTNDNDDNDGDDDNNNIGFRLDRQRRDADMITVAIAAAIAADFGKCSSDGDDSSSNRVGESSPPPPSPPPPSSVPPTPPSSTPSRSPAVIIDTIPQASSADLENFDDSKTIDDDSKRSVQDVATVARETRVGEGSDVDDSIDGSNRSCGNAVDDGMWSRELSAATAHKAAVAATATSASENDERAQQQKHQPTPVTSIVGASDDNGDDYGCAACIM